MLEVMPPLARPMSAKLDLFSSNEKRSKGEEPVDIIKDGDGRIEESSQIIVMSSQILSNPLTFQCTLI